MTMNGFFPEDAKESTIIHWPPLPVLPEFPNEEGQVYDPKNDIVYRLRKRAEIRRQIPSRKSVQENKPDKIADLLEEAANEIVQLRDIHKFLEEQHD